MPGTTDADAETRSHNCQLARTRPPNASRMRSDVLTSPVRRLVGGVSIAIALGLAAALALPVSGAAADPINLAACNNAVLSQAFAPWADPSSYELAPGGDFETAA